MRQISLVSKILAFAGCLLVWLTILSPLLFGAADVIVNRGRFHLDYLMPAEFFPVALVGGGLLFFSAWRARSQRGLIGWGLGAALTALVASQGLAVVTGLASGETQPADLWWVLVFVLLVIYILALIVVGLGGFFLVRNLFTVKR